MPHTPEERARLIDAIRELPEQLAQEVAGWTDEQLDFRPAPGEWSARQVVHHVVDSHLNGYVRCKWLLTEDNPTIKTYDQERWAELIDSTAPLELSFGILRGLHARWVLLLEGLTPEQWARTGLHPESGAMTLDSLLDTYSWHGMNHVRQIRNNRAAMDKTTSNR